VLENVEVGYYHDYAGRELGGSNLGLGNLNPMLWPAIMQVIETFETKTWRINNV
jgi:hypothetical protein